MKYYIDENGLQRRYYRINPRRIGFFDATGAPFVGKTPDGGQVIADIVAAPLYDTDPPGPALYAHWFNADGDFLRYEGRPILRGLPEPPKYPYPQRDVSWQMLAWMEELGVTQGPVEVKKFSCKTGMFIQDPMIDVDEYDAEYDFDYAQKEGIYHLYWQRDFYIGRADGTCTR